jgi:hypothetical protein
MTKSTRSNKRASKLLVAPLNNTTAANAVDSASAVIAILGAAGWSDEEILVYFSTPDSACDAAYEQKQIRELGGVEITAAEMRAQLQRLLVHPTLHPRKPSWTLRPIDGWRWGKT